MHVSHAIALLRTIFYVKRHALLINAANSLHIFAWPLCIGKYKIYRLFFRKRFAISCKYFFLWCSLYCQWNKSSISLFIFAVLFLQNCKRQKEARFCLTLVWICFASRDWLVSISPALNTKIWILWYDSFDLMQFRNIKIWLQSKAGLIECILWLSVLIKPVAFKIRQLKKMTSLKKHFENPLTLLLRSHVMI